MANRINKNPPRTGKREPSIPSDAAELRKAALLFKEEWGGMHRLGLPREVIQGWYMSPNEFARVQEFLEHTNAKPTRDETIIHFRAVITNPLTGEPFQCGKDFYTTRPVWRRNNDALGTTLMVHHDMMPGEVAYEVDQHMQFLVDAKLFITTFKHLVDECSTYEQLCYYMPFTANIIDKAGLREKAGDIAIRRMPPSLPPLPTIWRRAVKACNDFVATQILLQSAAEGFQRLTNGYELHSHGTQSVSLMMGPGFDNEDTIRFTI